MSLAVVGYSVSGKLGTCFVYETFNGTCLINYHLDEILGLLYYSNKKLEKIFSVEK